MAEFINLKRSQLEQFCPDEDAIRQFEKLFSIANNNQTASGEDALIVAETALAKANSLEAIDYTSNIDDALLVAETALAKANSVKSEVESSTFWQRNGTTLSPQNAGDDLQIDSFVRFNGSSDTEQLIVKGHSTQTVSLQEWQDNASSVLTSVNSDGSIDLKQKLKFTGTPAQVSFNNDEILISRVANKWLTIETPGSTLSYWADGSWYQNTATFEGYNWFVGNLNKSYGLVQDLGVVGAIAFRGTGNSFLGIPMKFSAYNYYTTQTTWEKGGIDWITSSNVFKIWTEAGSAGGTVRPIEIEGAGTTVIGTNTTDVVLTAKGVAGQTGNLQEWQDSIGTTVASISNGGKLAPNYIYIPNNAGATITDSGTYLYTAGGWSVLNNQGGNGIKLQKNSVDILQMDTNFFRVMQEATFNFNFTDDDFIINKNVSGQAYKYDAGLDRHDFYSVTKHRALEETKVTSSTTETLSVQDSTYINIDTAGNTLSLSNMVDGSKMQINNSSAGDATLNFDIKYGTSTFTAPVTMPSGDSYELVYDSGSATWVM